MHKYVLLCFMTLFLAFSCVSDDDDGFSPPAPCITLASEINIALSNSDASRTNIIVDGFTYSTPSLPNINGCLMEIDDRVYNLDQLISYRLIPQTNQTIVEFQFP